MGAEEFFLIVAVITFIGQAIVFFGWWKKILTKAWHFISRSKPRVPRETIRVVPKIRACHWSIGTVDREPAMFVAGNFYVTNIINVPVSLLLARLSKPRIDEMVSTKHPNNDIFGSYPIMANGTTEAMFHFWITPPVCKIGENFIATVSLIDQYGNEHKVRNVVFKGDLPKKNNEEEQPFLESTFSIKDPIEKDVVAVLKSEVYRYKNCGRSVGGLGSIQTIFSGHTYKGIGPEIRKSDSPENQSIEKNEDEISITSDNAQALLKLHDKLIVEDEKERFYRALLKRVSRDTEYSDIGYFILFIMFELGKLDDLLQKAKLDLYKDGKHGFSNLLMLLGGLLRFKHSSFTTEMLDLIEKFLHDLDEHLFRIPERLSAIRAYRLSKQE